MSLLLSNEQSKMPGLPRDPRVGWGHGIEAQRLQRVNIMTRELQNFERQIANLTGLPKVKVEHLRLMARVAEVDGAKPLDRTSKRGKWSLMGYEKEVFKTPEAFVERAKKARLPFVSHLQWDGPEVPKSETPDPLRLVQKKTWGLEAGAPAEFDLFMSPVPKSSDPEEGALAEFGGFMSLVPTSSDPEEGAPEASLASGAPVPTSSDPQDGERAESNEGGWWSGWPAWDFDLDFL